MLAITDIKPGQVYSYSSNIKQHSGYYLIIDNTHYKSAKSIDELSKTHILIDSNLYLNLVKLSKLDMLELIKFETNLPTIYKSRLELVMSNL